MRQSMALKTFGGPQGDGIMSVNLDRVSPFWAGLQRMLISALTSKFFFSSSGVVQEYSILNLNFFLYQFARR